MTGRSKRSPSISDCRINRETALDPVKKTDLDITVNGVTYQMAVEPRKTLLEFLREDLNLTGAKEGCGLGECGTCTVLLDGKPIKSCITLALQADGREVTTIEGMENPDGTLHPIQQAFIDHGAIQCGFCTPGMALSAKALLDENRAPTEFEVRQAIAGNLCRCTGYQKIVEAILSVSKQEFAERVKANNKT
jgi:carbon-monoxide dehydrogenase small subunit